MKETFTDAKGRPVCPASIYGNLFEIQPHFTTAAQIAKHGVCKKCYRQMKESGKAVFAGKVETPVNMSEPDHRPSLQQDAIGYGDDGHLTNSVDFDWAEIDRLVDKIEDEPAPVQEQAAALVKKIFAFCFVGRKKKFSGKNLKTAALRLAVICSSLRPTDFDDVAHGELAAALGMGKAAASKAITTFEDRVKIKFPRTQSKAARASMREARLEQVQKRNQRPCVGPPVKKEAFTPRPQGRSDGTPTKGYDRPKNNVIHFFYATNG